MKKRKITQKELTIVEMVVIFLLGIMVIAIISRVLPRAQEGARRAACLNNIRQIGLAMSQYAMDNNETFPGIASPKGSVTSTSVFLSLTNGSYLKPGPLYVCPSNKLKTAGSLSNFTAENNSYNCVVADSSGLQGLTVKESGETPLVIHEGLKGVPDYLKNISQWEWDPAYTHGTKEGIVFSKGGTAFFKHSDFPAATNGYVVAP